MKLFISLFLACTLFTFAAEGQKTLPDRKENDRELRELTGDVRSVRIERTLVYGNEFAGGWIPSLTLYNRDGFVQEFIAYNDKNEFDYKSTGEFDPTGNKILETNYDRDGKILIKTLRSFDARGRVTEMKQYGNADLSLMAWAKFIYNDKGRLVSDTFFSKQGQPLSTNKYLYNRNGKKKESVSYDSAGKLTHQSKSYYKDKNVEKLVFDNSGNLKFHYLTLINEAGDDTELAYDKNGKILRKDTYTYERDARGNWVKELCSEWEGKDGVLTLKRVKITTRTIAYYQESQ